MFATFSDDELVDLARQGDNRAFAELIRRHQPSAMAQALAILRDRSDAEDEVQNACWKAFSHLNQFNNQAKFSTWFARIVVNQCLMRLRQHRRAKFQYLDATEIGDESGATIELPDPAATPEQEMARQEVTATVRREMNRLPKMLRDAVVLRDMEQLPIEAVAAQLGVSVAAAKSRLLRARSELRTRMERHQGRLGPATLLPHAH